MLGRSQDSEGGGGEEAGAPRPRQMCGVSLRRPARLEFGMLMSPDVCVAAFSNILLMQSSGLLEDDCSFICV